MSPVRYRIEHETRYEYGAPVSDSWQLGRLTPRRLPWQQLLWQRLELDPEPDETDVRVDTFGNTVTSFALHRAHRALLVRMRCEVQVGERPAWAAREPESWHAVRDALIGPAACADLSLAFARETTAALPWSHAAAEYAAKSLVAGRDWFDAVHELMRRIHADFEFQSGATTVSTPVETVLAERKGVCQDFAHLMITCLRTMGLPARYVSGYLLTRPPPGKPRLVGADATHAWVSAYSPQHGWVEFDPTNDCLADARYVTLGWGGDFFDVAPLRGVILGGGEQKLEVEVSVWPVEGATEPVPPR
jgi:transglutaminase-like putative cysteine protease